MLAPLPSRSKDIDLIPPEKEPASPLVRGKCPTGEQHCVGRDLHPDPSGFGCPTPGLNLRVPRRGASDRVAALSAQQLLEFLQRNRLAEMVVDSRLDRSIARFGRVIAADGNNSRDREVVRFAQTSRNLVPVQIG
jgi:hypothetical protein